jgi:hypothetical protein
MRKVSLEFPEADPWGSPAMHKGHNHQASPPKSNGTSRGASVVSNGVHEPVRTTSTFTTASTEGSNGASHRPSEDTQATPAWGSYDSNINAPFSNSGDSTIGGDGFDGEGGGGGDRPTPTAPTRSFGGGQTVVQRRMYLLVYCRRRKACLCFNITIIKSPVPGGEVRSYGGIATLFGFSIVYKNDILSDSYPCSRLKELEVC